MQKQSRSKPLIDYAFPAELVEQLARLESYNRHLYRPNSYLHKWWARRCGTTFRAILKSLVEDERSSSFYAPGGLQGKVILDPMMGGGTTLHEAIRLGANVIGVDIDPIPVLQARATLTHVPISSIEAAFASLFRALSNAISDQFKTACPCCDMQTDTRFTLYGLKKSCQCGTTIVLDSLVLRHENDGSKWVICPYCGDVYLAPMQHNVHDCTEQGHEMSIRSKDQEVCPDCGIRFAENLDIPFFSRYEMVAVAGECDQHGLFFRTPSDQDRNRQRVADDARSLDWIEDQSNFEVTGGPKSNALLNRGIHSYLDLFSSRQISYLRSATKQLGSLDSEIRLILGLLISTSTEFNSMLCGYKGGAPSRPGAIRHVFSHHAYSFPHTALENNPVYPGKSSGSLMKLFSSRVLKARKWALRPRERRISKGRSNGYVYIEGEIDQGIEVRDFEQLRSGERKFLAVQKSSVNLPFADHSIDHIVTDPPYYDNVQYGDLSEFFRVWLRRFFPQIMDWTYDVSESAVDSYEDGLAYRNALRGIFSECNRLLARPNGRLIFTFHHWRPTAWAALTYALANSAMCMVAYYVVHSENPASVHIANLNALEHDAVLVFSPSCDRDKKSWPVIDHIDTSTSKEFTRGCAAALGSMLSRLSRYDEMLSTWERLIPIS